MDGQPLQTVNLSSLQDGIGTDNQTIDTFSLSGTTLQLSLEDDGQPLQTVNLSSLQDGIGTDNQTIDAFSLSGTTLQLSLEDDGQPLQTVNLSSLQDGIGTDNQTIDTFSLSGTTLQLSLEDDGQPLQTVNLSSLSDNTTASNGLTETGSDIRLGGNLIQPTTISQGVNSFDINLNSTGDFAIQDNGTDVLYVEDSGDVGFGTSNPNYQIDVLETGSTELRAVNVVKTDNYNGSTYGIYTTKTASGVGRSHAVYNDATSTGTGNNYAIYNVTDGSGTGSKYGTFNEINSTASGSQYGLRNWIRGTTSALQIGTFNNLINNSTGDQYGVYNGMRNSGGSNQVRGVHNEFDTAGNVAEFTGVRNQMSNGTPGAIGMMGIYTVISNSNNGDYYGSRNEYTTAATGTGNKYGTYNLISTSAGGTQYGTYNSVSTNNGWAGYFLGRNYISERLSIGETNNANARISILNNSGGSNPAHIELRETAAGDGARIRFNNDVETTNEWILYGLADNTVADSRFNVFHTTTGNVITATGDGDVGITGNADTDFHVFHGNNGNADGMKLQNTNDNTWWRFYVSSGSDDLRLFNSNNGTTIMGVFNDATGAYTATSDRRLKKDFKDLYFSWDNFMQLEPLTYKYKKDKQPSDYIGMVAQDVEKIYPELINYSEEEDIYHMDYSATGVVAIKGVQELKKENDALTKRVAQLEALLNKYEALEARLSALENKNAPVKQPTVTANK